MRNRVCLQSIALFISFVLSAKSFSQTLFAYISNANSNNVSVINTSTNAVSATVAVGSGPRGVAVTSDGSKVYVTNYSSNSVSIINAATNTVAATVAVGASPLGVAVSPDGSKVYVANGSSNNVSVINTATNTVSATVAAGTGPFGIAVTPDGSKVYVANRSSNNVTVINTSTNTVAATVTAGTYANGIAVSPDGSKVYVTNFNSNNVTVINTATNTVAATVTVGTNPQGVTVSPDGSKVYVANYGTNNVSVIDAATNNVSSSIAAGTGPRGVAVIPDGSKLYVANSMSNNVSVINTASNTIVATVTAGTTPFPLGNFIKSSINTLPIHFLQVSASEKTNGTVGVSWKVTEDGIERYEVERSTNGSQFEKKASLLSNRSSSYSWTDGSPDPEINYYRIKAVETSGNVTYSKILNVALGSKRSGVAVYPNPVEDKTLAIQFLNKPAGRYQLAFINTAGQTVFQTALNHAGGSGSQAISLPPVAKGLYQVSISNAMVKATLLLLVK